MSLDGRATLIKAAEEAEQTQDWAEAKTLWERVRVQAPDAPSGYIGESRALRALGNRAEADALLSAARLRLGQAHLKIALEFASSSHTDRDWPEAVERWQYVRDRFPGERDAVVRLGQALVLDGRYEAAEAVLSEGVARFPSHAQLHFDHAYGPVYRDKLDDAIARLRHVKTQFPQTISIYTGLAETLTRMERYDEAESILTEAQERFPPRVDVAAQLARISESRRDWTEAASRWLTVRRHFPDHPSSYVGSLFVLRLASRLEEAAAVLDTALAKFPERFDVLNEQAELAAAKGDLELATGYWTSIKDRFPDRPSGYIGLAAMLHRLRRLDEAERVLEEGIERFPQGTGLLAEHARIAVTAGNWPAAARRWARITARLPANAGATLGLIEAHINLKNIDEATTAADVLLANSPRNVNAVIMRARCDMGAGLWHEAVARLTLASELGSGNQTINKLLFEARLRLLLDSDPATETDGTPEDEQNMPRADIGQADVVLAGGAEAKRIRSLFMEFESLGDNCEFGLLQRHFGAEPLGLLRWAAIAPTKVIEALDARFRGVGLPENTELSGSVEYATRDKNYGMTMHTFLGPRDGSHDELYPKLCRRLQFLARKMIEDLTLGSKIFVYKYIGHLTSGHIVRIADCLERYGPNRLLCVLLASDEHEAGTVELVSPNVALGYISKFGNDQGNWNIDFTGWLEICTKAADLMARPRTVETRMTA